MILRITFVLQITQGKAFASKVKLLSSLDIINFLIFVNFLLLFIAFITYVSAPKQCSD